MWNRFDKLIIGSDDVPLYYNEQLPDFQDTIITDFYVWNRVIKRNDMRIINDPDVQKIQETKPDVSLIDLVFDTEWTGSVNAQFQFVGQENLKKQWSYYATE